MNFGHGGLEVIQDELRSTVLIGKDDAILQGSLSNKEWKVRWELSKCRPPLVTIWPLMINRLIHSRTIRRITNCLLWKKSISPKVDAEHLMFLKPWTGNRERNEYENQTNLDGRDYIPPLQCILTRAGSVAFLADSRFMPPDDITMRRRRWEKHLLSNQKCEWRLYLKFISCYRNVYVT